MVRRERARASPRISLANRNDAPERWQLSRARRFYRRERPLFLFILDREQGKETKHDLGAGEAAVGPAQAEPDDNSEDGHEGEGMAMIAHLLVQKDGQEAT